ncbi:MAG: fructosamine kinase family protein [Planctomycetota bacterium]|jgi:fructosamine-3-kinase
MTALPVSVRAEVGAALAEAGYPSKIVGVIPASGGCINHGARIDLAPETSLFLKWNASAPVGMFQAEMDGLRAMRGATSLRVPNPIAHGGGPGAPDWLLMEYAEAGRAAEDYGTVLGRGLAEMHGAPAPDQHGWHRDNWIGSLAQANPPTASWAAFWRDQRLSPQIEEARRRGHLGSDTGDVLHRLLDLVPLALADVEDMPPSLLHGDLWSGNAYADERGQPVLIDPAVYAGHGEVDLAMTELFGGFGRSFYAAYDEARPISAAYGAYRRHLYQLYYLLVHVNLFGFSYVSGSLDAAARVVSALS